MSDTLMRQWHMLRLIPRHPSKRDTSEIKHLLADEGFDTTPRTIQRDLMAFSSVFPLVCDDRSKPYGWSWTGDVMDVPGMDTHTALAFFLADKYLEPMLPRETIQHLKPHFDKARQVLDAIPTASGAPSWRGKVCVLRRGQFLSAPIVAPVVQNEIYDALLLNRRVRFDYRSRSHGGTREYEVNPLGIVLKDAVIYLVCTCWDYADIRLLPLQRMSKAKQTNIPVSVPDGFELDAYIASGELDFADGGEIRLNLKVSSDVAYHLRERPLDSQQRLVEQADGAWMCEATVLETGELRWWLLGFGAQVEVLDPVSLRDEFRAVALAMVENYSD